MFNVKEPIMSTLIAMVFDSPYDAEKARLELRVLEKDELVDLEESVVLTRHKKGHIHFHHSQHFTLPMALSGGFVGTLVGLMILNPAIALIGGITGTGLRAVLGALKEIGIEEDFIKDLADGMWAGSSALFIVTRRGDSQKIMEALKPYGGKIFCNALYHQDESQLKAACLLSQKDVSHEDTSSE
jgi:uncharacterized membrane protein